MKKLIKKLFRALGFEIKKVPNSIGGNNPTQVVKQVDLLKQDKFEIELTHLILDSDHYFVPKYAEHRPAAKDFLNGIFYEPETHNFVRDFCRSYNGSIVHAGTFFGDMIPSFSRSVSGKVYAFEPVLENYILARLCLDHNHLQNVVLMNAALSNEMDNLFINTSESEGRHAGGASTISNTGSICTSINIDRLNIDDLVLIQLDVEGHELIALQGAESTINKCRPAIAIEDNNNNCSEYLVGLNYEPVGEIPGLTLWSPLEDHGYKETIVTFINKTKSNQ